MISEEMGKCREVGGGNDNCIIICFCIMYNIIGKWNEMVICLVLGYL